MVQIVGGIVVVLALIGAVVYVWLTFGKGTKVGQSTVGKFITRALESAQLTTNLGYVELLSRVDAIEANPQAVKACDLIADVLWTAAKDAWKEAQQPTAVVDPVTAKTVKVTTVSEAVVEVPVA